MVEEATIYNKELLKTGYVTNKYPDKKIIFLPVGHLTDCFASHVLGN